MTTNRPPLISVCMPVYNAAAYLAEAVESILGQTLADFEFLILDDGSTDGSLRVLRRYARHDPRIRLSSRPHRGVAASLNDLVDQARGEFLARMDADDISLPGRFARQVEYLRAHPECVLVGCRVWHADPEGDPLEEYLTLGEHEEIDAFHFLNRGPALLHPSVMMRRDAVQAVGKYRNFPMEDVDLYLRLAERGRLARVPEFLLHYRVHAQNISRSKEHFERAYPAICEILIDACRRRNLPATLPPRAEPVPPPDPQSLDRDWAWAWRTLFLGHRRTALKYARRVLARRPLAPDSWRLMFCVLRGH
jgi:glycosyltransferase involved in cell wall biosynthesis